MEIIKTPATERVNPTNVYKLTVDTDSKCEGSHTCVVFIADDIEELKKYIILLKRIEAFKQGSKKYDRADYNYLKGFSKLFIEQARRSWNSNEYWNDWFEYYTIVYYDSNGTEFDVEVELNEEELEYALDESIWRTDPLMEWSEDYDDEYMEEEDEDES